MSRDPLPRVERQPDEPREPREPAAAELWSPRLSSEQLRFYFLHQLNPRDPDLSICRALRITGALEIERLRRSVRELARRHDILRCKVVLDEGEPRLALAKLDEAGDAAFDEPADPADESAPFELDRAPLFRVTVVPDGARHLVALRFHHLLADGASVQLFLRELWETYQRLALGELLERPAHQFRDFIEWEHRRDTREARADHRAYWRARLAGSKPLDLAIPRHRRRPERHTRAAGTVHAALDAELRAALRAFCQAQRVTPYMVMLAVLQQLLHQLTGERDVLIGTPVAYRQRREFQQMIGVQVSWIALRGQLRPASTFLERLLDVRRELPSAYVHQTSYEALLAAAAAAAPGGALPRDPTRNPLLQITLNYTRHEPLPAPPGLEIEIDPVEQSHTPYDLALRFEEIGEACALGLTYYEGAMDRAAAERVSAAFLALTAHCLAHLDRPLEEAPSPRLDFPSEEAPAAPPRRIVLAATFTAEPVQPILEHWLEQLELPTAITFAPFDQIFQQLIDPASLLARNAHGPNVLLIRCEDWKDPEVAAGEFTRLLADHAERSAAPTVIVVCPPSAARRKGATPARERDLALALIAALGALPRTHVLTWQEIVARYPVEVIDDAEGDAYARAPYSADFHVALGTAIARQLHALLRPAPKVLVLDCDHTLWHGVVGEDGPHGLVIDEGHRALQRFALEQREAGVLLCLASKNDEADVWEAFATAPGMLLRREMIAAHRIDWRAKSHNLHALAAELGLGVESFVLLDDSPLECAEVRGGCPGALVLRVPARSAELPRFLEHLWALDRRPLTATDLQRPELYAARARRQQLRRAAPDRRQFLVELAVQTSFPPLSRETLARAAQLTQRTNQFNTTTVRRSEAELLELQAAGAELLLVEASDRFGDYGLVGLAVHRSDAASAALEVSAWMLSCRALGRGVEHRVLAELGRRAASLGLARVDVAFRRTAKNQPVHHFLEQLAVGHREATDVEAPLVYRIPVDQALAAPSIEIADDGAAADLSVDSPPSIAEASSIAATPALWQTIATERDTVAKIRDAIRSTRKRAQPQRAPSAAFLAPRDDLERAIAAAWSEILLVEQLGVHDDYFAIGGDSLRSLAVVAQLRRAGLAATVLELHEHPTVAQLAAVLRSRISVETPPATTASPPISTGPYPLSFSQRYVVETYALHNLQTAAPPTGVFHLQDRFSIREPHRRSSIPALRRALTAIVRHTSQLRTKIFHTPAGWRQLELPSFPELLEVRDLTQKPAGAHRQAEIDRILALDRQRPFDPERSGAAMIRGYALVVDEDNDENQNENQHGHDLELILTAHHGFCDGWSLQNAYNQLFALYDAHQRGDEPRIAAIEAELAARDGGFRAFVQREQMETAAVAHWQAQRPLRPLRNELPLGEPQTLRLPIDWKLVERAGERASASRTSFKAVLLDAFAAALAEHQASPAPLVVAVVTNGRKDDLPGPMDVFGLCWTFTPIEIPSRRSLTALHRDLLAAEAHARAPIERMFQGAIPEAVVHASFNLTSFHNASWRAGTADLQITKRNAFHRFPFPLDLHVHLDEPARTAALKVSWISGTFDEPSARALLAAFVAELG